MVNLEPTTLRNILATFSTRPYKDILFVTEGIKWVTSGEIDSLSEVLQSLGISRRISGPILVGFPRQAIFYPSVYFLRHPRRYLLPKCRIAFPYYHGYPGSGKKLFDVCFNNLKKYHHKITRIQTSNSYMKNIILESGIDAEKVFLIPIAIKGECFSIQSPLLKEQARKAFDIPQSAVVIGSFQKDGEGWNEGLNPKMVKGPDIFLKTISILKASIPELFVLLAGPARGYVKKGLEELAVPYKHVFLEDYMKIGSLYHCLDVYMVTSRQEGGPKSVLESMASGVPLVTTRVGQAMDLVKNEQNGIIVDIEDTQALAFACEKFLNDGQFRHNMITNAGETAKANTYNAHIPLWRDFFEGFVDMKGAEK
ncbi:MAG: glycosyltransferase family 4 protein [Sedimentisphaerales bacterium]|nr:glycosyltransferase family 4 protein [Sedimentisphaerales bacterium]